MPCIMGGGKSDKEKQKFANKVLKLARKVYMEEVNGKKLSHNNFLDIGEAYTKIAVFLEQLYESEIRRRLTPDFSNWYFKGYFEQMERLLKSQSRR